MEIIYKFLLFSPIGIFFIALAYIVGHYVIDKLYNKINEWFLIFISILISLVIMFIGIFIWLLLPGVL